jgi:tyrosine-protein kinase Etk/Wzc
MTDQTTTLAAEQEVSDEINLLDLLQVVADNLRLLILGPLAVGFIALGVSFLITPTFSATTTFLQPQQQQSSAVAILQTMGALSGVAGGATGFKNLADQYMALAGSRTVEDAIVDRFELLKRYDKNLRQDAREFLEKVTEISSGKDGLIKIEVSDEDPNFAANLANAYVEELSKLMGRMAVTEAQQRRAFFEAQLIKVKEGLSKAEIALKATGISESAIKVNPETAVESIANLMAQVAAKEVQLNAMRNYLTEIAPDFKRAQSELAALRQQLANAEKDTAGSGGGGDYVSKYRDFKFYEILFELTAKQYEIARIDESRERGVIQVVDIAIPPERKSNPKKAKITIAATLATSIVLLFFVFVRQALRHAQKNPDTAQKLGFLLLTLRRALGKI